MGLDYTPTDGLFSSTGQDKTLRYPLTMACWIRADSFPVQELCLMAVGSGRATSSNDYFELLTYDLFGGDDSISISSSVAGSADLVSCSATLSTGTWYHACGVFRDINDREVFHNGTGDTNTSTLSKDPLVINMMSVGTLWTNNTHVSAWDGQISLPTFWNVALSDAEVDALANGTHPQLIRPANIWAGYWNQSPDVGRLLGKGSKWKSWAFTNVTNGGTYQGGAEGKELVNPLASDSYTYNANTPGNATFPTHYPSGIFHVTGAL